MNDPATSYQRVSVQPFDCVSKAWELLSDRYWLFFGITFVGVLLMNLVPFAILAGPMMCGIYLCWFRLMRGEPVSFEMLFKGFDYFVESLIATLIIVGIVLVVIVPAYILIFVVIAVGGAATEGNADAMGPLILLTTFVLGLAVFAISLAIGLFTLFVYPLIVDRGLKAIPALKTSFAAARANFGGVLGLILAIALIGMVAALLCYLPVFFVAPVCLGAVAVAYRKIFPAQPAATP